MIFNIKNLKEGVVERLEADYDPKEFDLEFVDFHYLQNIHVTSFAEKILQTVTFRGNLSSRVEQICARCLEKIETEINSPFELSYDAEGRDSVDVTDDFRDILILNHPDRFLCTESCHGICAKCGANLNRESCRCS